jgi:hypothetical protein
MAKQNDGPVTFLPENRSIQFAYLPEFTGPIGNIQTTTHSFQLYVYNTDSTTITLGFNPLKADVFFMDGPAGSDVVSISLTTVSGQPAVDLSWNVTPSGRLIQYDVFEVVT